MNRSDKDIHCGRRELLTGAAATLMAGAASAQVTTGAAAVSSPMSDRIPIDNPRSEFVYEAIVDIAPSMDLGTGPLGKRAMVPITGGTFEGPNIRGRVLAGGADRQLVRDDGFRLLDALYELETHDGAVITVRNRVMISPDSSQRRLSALEITAPAGPYEWLNHSVHVGTLNSLRPDRAAVLIRVFRLV